MESPSDAPPSGRALLRAGGGLAVALGLSGCIVSTTPYIETVERSFDSGDVSVAPGDGDAVEATVEKESRSGEDALELRSTNGDVRPEAS